MGPTIQTLALASQLRARWAHALHTATRRKRANSTNKGPHLQQWSHKTTPPRGAVAAEVSVSSPHSAHTARPSMTMLLSEPTSGSMRYVTVPLPCLWHHGSRLWPTPRSLMWRHVIPLSRGCDGVVGLSSPRGLSRSVAYPGPRCCIAVEVCNKNHAPP